MRVPTIALVCLVALAGQAAADPVDAKALRDLLAMPKASATFNVGYCSALRGTVINDDKSEYPAAIARLEKALTGGPEDADRYMQLSDLYEDEAKSKRAAQLALECARTLQRSDPRRAEYVRLVGDALVGVEDYAAAEKTLREAVALDPRNADCWISLGERLQGVMLDMLRGKEEFHGNLKLAGPALRKRLPDAANVARFLAYASQAGTCFDQAIALAPRSLRAYRSRANFRQFGTMLSIFLTEAGLQPAEHPFMAPDYGKNGCLGDLRTITELCPDSPRDIALWMNCELTTMAMNGNLDAAKRTDADNPIVQCRAKLEALRQRNDPVCAGEACFFLGILEMAVIDDAKSAEAHFRRDESLRPESRHSEILLDGALLLSGKNAELIARCEKRLRTRDEVPTRHVAAQAHWALGAFKEAETHVRAGLRLDPADLRCALGLAVLLMKRGDPAGLAEAGDLLKNVQPRVKESEFADEAAVLRGMHLALAGDPKAARAALVEIACRNTDQETARKALRILGAPPRDDPATTALREAAATPDFCFNVNIGFDADTNLQFEGLTTAPAAEIAVLERALAASAATGPTLADVERWRRMQLLLMLHPDPARKKEVALRGVAAARTLCEREPTNPRFLLALGQACAAAEQMDEAERLIRQVTTQYPGDVDCWIALGRCCTQRAVLAAWEGGPQTTAIKDAAKCRKYLDLSSQCFDRAVALAPDSARVYRARANGGFCRGMMQSALEGRVGDGGLAWSQMFTEPVLADLQKNSELAPTDAAAIGTLIWFRSMLAKESESQVAPASGPENPVRERMLRLMAEGRKRLETLADDRDPKIAGDANYAIGALMMKQSKDWKGALPYLLRDEKLQPDLDRSTRLIDDCLIYEKHLDEVIRHSMARIERNENPASRWMLASAYFNGTDYDLAEHHLRAGLKLAPADVPCNLCLAAVLLRCGGRESLAEIDARLGVVERTLGLAADRAAETTVLRCIHLALSGDAVSARRRLRELLAKDADNEAASKLLKTLGE
jgi:tetratricopeptide (TPR) repeat protein